MEPVKDFTFQNWFNGKLDEENYFSKYLQYEIYYDCDPLSEQDWQAIDAEKEKIHRAKMDAFTKTADHNLKVLKIKCHKDIEQAPSRTQFIQQTIKRYQEYLAKNDHKRDVRLNLTNVSFFNRRNYMQFLADNILWGEYPHSETYYYDDVHINMFVYEMFLKYLRSDKGLTLWDFFEGTEKEQQGLMKDLCETKIYGEAILQYKNAQYRWIYKGTYSKRYLSGMILALSTHGWVDFKEHPHDKPLRENRISQRLLDQIVFNTFGCTIGRPNAERILEDLLDKKYTKPFIGVIKDRQ